MALVKKFESFAWFQPNWGYPTVDQDIKTLLEECVNYGRAEFSGDLGEVVARSLRFPVPFPIDSVRLSTLKERRPLDRLRNNIRLTYPVFHERVLLLMANFLQYKKEFGTTLEKELYKDMTLTSFIDRLLKKRAVSFVGKNDAYKLFRGEEGLGNWESIGTPQEKPPLTLRYNLSYDEIKLSSLLFVSGPTECINDGTRHNKGVVNEDDIEEHVIIIGAIGPRLKRPNRMECEDILVTAEQNTALNGYGNEKPTSWFDSIKHRYHNTEAKRMWRQLWADFYQVPSVVYEEILPQVKQENATSENKHTDRHVFLPIKNFIFDNEVYNRRITILADTVLLEADYRAKDVEKGAFVNIVGCGLGVWMISEHQADVYVLSCLQRVQQLLQRQLLQHVADVNFSYIKVTDSVSDLFPENDGDAKKMFLENKLHPKGGINVTLRNRSPSARLDGADEGKLLVITYPWDGNAQPGNEFWFGNLNGSGDSAAASSTQIAELHNAHINLRVCCANGCVATATGLCTLQDYCIRA